MQKGKFGFRLWVYPVAAILLVIFDQSLAATLVVAFGIAAEKNDWVSHQLLQVFFFGIFAAVKDVIVRIVNCFPDYCVDPCGKGPGCQAARCCRHCQPCVWDCSREASVSPGSSGPSESAGSLSAAGVSAPGSAAASAASSVRAGRTEKCHAWHGSGNIKRFCTECRRRPRFTAAFFVKSANTRSAHEKEWRGGIIRETGGGGIPGNCRMRSGVPDSFGNHGDYQRRCPGSGYAGGGICPEAGNPGPGIFSGL